MEGEGAHLRPFHYVREHDSPVDRISDVLRNGISLPRARCGTARLRRLEDLECWSLPRYLTRLRLARPGVVDWLLDGGAVHRRSRLNADVGAWRGRARICTPADSHVVEALPHNLRRLGAELHCTVVGQRAGGMVRSNITGCGGGGGGQEGPYMWHTRQERRCP